MGVTLEDLTFTEEEIDMCNNDETCLFDLAVTGDEEFANTTLESSEEDKKLQEAIRELLINIPHPNIYNNLRIHRKFPSQYNWR